MAVAAVQASGRAAERAVGGAGGAGREEEKVGVKEAARAAEVAEAAGTARAARARVRARARVMAADRVAMAARPRSALVGATSLPPRAGCSPSSYHRRTPESSTCRCCRPRGSSGRRDRCIHRPTFQFPARPPPPDSSCGRRSRAESLRAVLWTIQPRSQVRPHREGGRWDDEMTVGW